MARGTVNGDPLEWQRARLLSAAEHAKRLRHALEGARHAEGAPLALASAHAALSRIEDDIQGAIWRVDAAKKARDA